MDRRLGLCLDLYRLRLLHPHQGNHLHHHHPRWTRLHRLSKHRNQRSNNRQPLVKGAWRVAGAGFDPLVG